jgi:mRNA interferase MazF
VHLKKNEAGLKEASDILVDQVRAIDNSRFCKHLGILEDNSIEELRKCLSLILD